jgi:hypothetical protein
MIKHRMAQMSETDDRRVMSFRQWCELNGFSWWTGKRLCARGEGPIITRLSARRKGIQYRHHVQWLESRQTAAA